LDELSQIQPFKVDAKPKGNEHFEFEGAGVVDLLYF
jgi:hypothetical protein